MTPHRPHGAHRAVAIGLVAVFALASCSDSGDSSSTTASSAPDTTAAATETTGATGEPGFVFGYLRPAAGVLTEMATAQEAAIGLAVDDINAAGGVNGAPVSMIAVDESLSGDTPAAIGDLLDQGANMIIGPVSSTQAKDSLETLTTRGGLACSGSATAADLTTLDTGNVFYRTAMPDQYTMNAVADALTARATAAALPEGTPYKVSVLARADDYGASVGNSLASALIARGMAVQVVDYNPHRVSFTEESKKIAATSPDSVVLVSYGEAVRQIDSLVAAGVTTDKIIGLDGQLSPTLAERTFTSDPSQIDGMQVIAQTGDRAFIDRLNAVPGTGQVIYGAQAYDCTIIGALAAAAAKSADPAGYGPQIITVTDAGRSCSTVADCLTKLEAGDDIDYEGVSGGVRFNEQGDPAEARITTAGFQDGKLTEISSADLNLDDLRQQEAMAAAIFTTRLQQLLTVLGYYTGPIDGQWSDEMTASVAALQTDLGVPVTGVWDAATDAAVRAKYSNVTGALSESTMALQQLLTDLGLYSGPIDGVYSQAVVDSVKALQRQLGVPETGIVDAATLKAAYEKGITIGTPPTTTTPAATTVPPATTVAPPATTVPPPATTVAPPATTVAPPATTVPPVDPAAPTVMALLKADDRFTTLVTYLEAGGYTGETSVCPLVNGQRTFTLLAPTNDALGAVPDQAKLDAIVADPSKLDQVLAYHLIEPVMSLQTLGTLTSVLTVYGDPPLVVTNVNGVVQVNGIDTVAPEMTGCNGVVIPINGLLQPPA